jgi:hypothetical protein
MSDNPYEPPENRISNDPEPWDVSENSIFEIVIVTVGTFIACIAITTLANFLDKI